MVKLVDTLGLGSSSESCEGSSPFTRTNANMVELVDTSSLSGDILLGCEGSTPSVGTVF